MENITNVWCGPLPESSPYVKPFQMHYVQDGIEVESELIKVHDSVAIILYNKTTNKLIFVKQFRPAVYYGVVNKNGCDNENKIDTTKFPGKLGVTIELCAGIVDKDIPIKDIAREEILEECGFNVSADRIEEVMTYKSGTNGALQILFYCEVTIEDKVTVGGGVDDEIIDVVELSMEEVEDMVKQGANNTSPPSCLLGVMWFLCNKKPK